MSQNMAPESYLGNSNRSNYTSQGASSAHIDSELLSNVEKSHSTESHLSQAISSSGHAQQAFQSDQPSFSGDIASKEYKRGGLDADNSDLWGVGSNSNGEESAEQDDDSADEIGVVLSEKLGVWATELRDEVMMMKPSIQQQEEEDESMVTKAQLLLRDAIQYSHKLAALKQTGFLRGCAGSQVLLLRNDEGYCAPLSWQANKLKRIVDSSLEAEILALVEGLKEAIYMRELIEEICGLKEKSLKLRGIVDNQGTKDSIHSTTGVDNKRLRGDVATIKEMLNNKEVAGIDWIPGKRQLADCMSKREAPLWELLQVFQTGKRDLTAGRK